MPFNGQYGTDGYVNGCAEQNGYNMNKHKLQLGDLIKIHGWVMLSKLEPGIYEVVGIELQNGFHVYGFKEMRRVRGLLKQGKKKLRFWVKDIDPWIHQPNGDLNFIEKL